MTAIFRTTDLPEHVAFEAITDKFVVRGVYRHGRFAPNIREAQKTTRVYGALDTLVPELMKLEPFANNYGEGYYAIPVSGPARSVEDNVRGAIWHGWKRETIKVATSRLLALLEEAFAGQEDIKLPTVARFSQKAGCTCPCSPGFVLDTRVTRDRRPVDLWITPLEQASED